MAAKSQKTFGDLSIGAKFRNRGELFTKIAVSMAADRQHGIKLGNPRPAQALKVAQTANLARADAYAKSLLPVVQEIRAARVTTLRKIAQCLNARGLKNPRRSLASATGVPQPRLTTASAGTAWSSSSE
jgi:hypothetical protein